MGSVCVIRGQTFGCGGAALRHPQSKVVNQIPRLCEVRGFSVHLRAGFGRHGLPTGRGTLSFAAMLRLLHRLLTHNRITQPIPACPGAPR